MKSMKAYLDGVTVSLYPNIDKFEDELVTLLNEDRINRENTVADGSTVTITERRLLVIHYSIYLLLRFPYSCIPTLSLELCSRVHIESVGI